MLQRLISVSSCFKSAHVLHAMCFPKPNLFSNRLTIRSVTTNTDLQNEIYVGPLGNKVYYIKMFTLCSSTIGFTVPAVLVRELTKMANPAVLTQAVSCFIFTFFVFVTPLLIHTVTRKYVLNMYHDPVNDTYTAVTYSLFLKKRIVTFTVDEVWPRNASALFSTIVVKRKKIPLFLDIQSFKDLSHYKRIMGYDKPVDFQFFKDEEKDSVKSKN